MKIAMIGSKGMPARSGGVERHVEAVATRLAKAGHEVLVYTRPWYAGKKLEIGNWKLVVAWRGVQLITLPSIVTKHCDAISHTLMASLDVLRRDVDVVHYHGIGPSLLLWIPKLFSRATVVATFHCQDYHHQKWNGFARLMLRAGEWMACTVADETIVVSRELERYVWSAYQRHATYIPNGVTAVTRVSARTLKRWNLTRGSYIVYIGRLVRHKGVHTLIEAYRGLIQNTKIQNLNANLPLLVIVGAGANTPEYEAELKRIAKGLPIRFVGEQTGEALAALTQHARVLVHPSISEGMSLLLLEAMAAGTPVLASNIPENREVLGRSGTSFVADDVHDASRKLQWCLAHPKTMTRRARIATRISREYNWDQVVADLTDRYVRMVWIKQARPVELQGKPVR